MIGPRVRLGSSDHLRTQHDVDEVVQSGALKEAAGADQQAVVCENTDLEATAPGFFRAGRVWISWANAM